MRCVPASRPVQDDYVGKVAGVSLLPGSAASSPPLGVPLPFGFGPASQPRRSRQPSMLRGTHRETTIYLHVQRHSRFQSAEHVVNRYEVCKPVSCETGFALEIETAALRPSGPIAQHHHEPGRPGTVLGSTHRRRPNVSTSTGSSHGQRAAELKRPIRQSISSFFFSSFQCLLTLSPSLQFGAGSVGMVGRNGSQP